MMSSDKLVESIAVLWPVYRAMRYCLLKRQCSGRHHREIAEFSHARPATQINGIRRAIIVAFSDGFWSRIKVGVNPTCRCCSHAPDGCLDLRLISSAIARLSLRRSVHCASAEARASIRLFLGLSGRSKWKLNLIRAVFSPASSPGLISSVSLASFTEPTAMTPRRAVEELKGAATDSAGHRISERSNSDVDRITYSKFIPMALNGVCGSFSTILLANVVARVPVLSSTDVNVIWKRSGSARNCNSWKECCDIS